MAVDLFFLSITDDSLQFLLGRTSKPRQNTAWAVRRIYIKSTYAWENNGFKGRNETKTTHSFTESKGYGSSPREI